MTTAIVSFTCLQFLTQGDPRCFISIRCVHLAQLRLTALTSSTTSLSERFIPAASLFGHLALIFAWVGGIYIAGARTSNYTAWLADPFSVAPAAQPVPRTVPGLPTFVQDVVNGDVGGGFASIQITSGVFHIWRAHGITTSSQLLASALTSLALAAICIFAGWFHFHRSVPTVAWFSNIDSLLNHHTAGLFGLGRSSRSLQLESGYAAPSLLPGEYKRYVS